MKYEQLPLTGDSPNDYGNTEDCLVDLRILENAIDEFLDKNKKFNPRQLYYMLNYIIYSKHLDVLIDWENTNS